MTARIEPGDTLWLVADALRNGTIVGDVQVFADADVAQEYARDIGVSSWPVIVQ